MKTQKSVKRLLFEKLVSPRRDCCLMSCSAWCRLGCTRNRIKQLTFIRLFSGQPLPLEVKMRHSLKGLMEEFFRQQVGSASGSQVASTPLHPPLYTPSIIPGIPSELSLQETKQCNLGRQRRTGLHENLWRTFLLIYLLCHKGFFFKKYSNFGGESSIISTCPAQLVHGHNLLPRRFLDQVFGRHGASWWWYH